MSHFVNLAFSLRFTPPGGSIRLDARAVEKQFDRADIEVVSTFLVNDEREEIDAAFGILVVLLVLAEELAYVPGPV